MPIDNRFVEVKTRDWRSQKYRAHITQPKNWAFPLFFSHRPTVKALYEIIKVFGYVRHFEISFREMSTKHVDFPFMRIQHDFIDLCEQAVLHCCCLCFSMNVGENAGMRTSLQHSSLLSQCVRTYTVHLTHEKKKIQWFWFRKWPMQYR